MKWSVIALGVDEKVKRALGKFCAQDKSAQFAGVARSITTLLFALEESSPELVVIDEYSLGEDPVSALTSIHHASSRSRLLIIGDTLDAVASWEVLQLGVAGNLRRAEACSQIWRAITAVKRGEFWLSRSQSSQLLTRLSVDELRKHVAVGNLDVLTPQENRVLQQCMVGQSNKEIASVLAISEQTVKIHLQHVFQKLGVRRRADLLLRRWVEPEKRTEGRRSHR
jgi:two-component system, NarL family, nitrate/nitrite response regulator NarL